MFNALRYAEELKKAGFTNEQATASLRILVDVMDKNFATRHDLPTAVSELKNDIALLESDMNHGFDKLRSEMKIKLGMMRAASIAIIVGLLKLL